MQIFLLDMGLIHEKHYSLLDTCIVENRNRYFSSLSKHRKQTIFAGDLLLRYTLLRIGIDISNIKIYYGEYGKPYLKSAPVYFNLSHSKNIVVLGIAKQELGIDVLYERKINEGFVPFFFSEEEQSYLRELEKSEKKEYYWNALCYKEAFTKRNGGRIIDMRNKLVCPKNLQYGQIIRIKTDGKEFESLFFKELNYHMCVIADKIPKETNFEILDMDAIWKELSAFNFI
ncbi:4'-phosphopantetheinyl transferase family protein [Bacillus cereus]|uniref:4'-phosphopantetheinyl transferase superfamily protein n=1 Tax=Bacillus cereus TaxID=1396 RepID=A0AAE9PID3_BACCE|nr:4'-phosphopantetheinyl transferase superfamily protein [Bacillus cereus]UYW72026.2 4'-phosphopantetheinyl transferase superfamily protein [Bacillus cereus]